MKYTPKAPPYCGVSYALLPIRLYNGTWIWFESYEWSRRRDGDNDEWIYRTAIGEHR